MTLTLTFLAQTFFGLLTSLFWLRVIMQWKRVSFINPVSQFVFKYTQPPVKILQLGLPNTRISWAAVIVTFLLQLGLLVVEYSVIGATPVSAEGYWSRLSFAAVFGSLSSLITVCTYLLVGFAIMSWIPQMRGSALGSVLWSLCSRIADRADRLIPIEAPIRLGVMLLIFFLILLRVILADVQMIMSNALFNAAPV